MNPTSSFWNNPPPPGTECDELAGEELSNSSTKRGGSTSGSGKNLDRVDQIIKSRDNVEYEKIKHRSRSRSRDHHKRRHSRSRSRDYHKSSYSSRKRRYRSRSKSRSYSRDRHRRRSRDRRHRHSSRYSHSRSRSKSRSRSHRSYKSRSERSRRSESSRSNIKHKSEEHLINNDANIIDMKIEEEEEEEEEEPEPTKENAFKNDGSFLETFKKLQEQQQQEAQQKNTETRKLLPSFGKRRGGKVLKTGIVQKNKVINEEVASAQDAWSVYMKEVKRYKEACCDDDSKTTPLTK